MSYSEMLNDICKKLYPEIHKNKSEAETRWVCPYCGNQLKGPIQPNEACCGEAGHAIQEKPNED